MKKLSKLGFILCLALIHLAATSCDFHFENESVHNWFDNSQTEIFDDQTEGIKQHAQTLTVPSNNKTIQPYHYAIFSVDINNHYDGHFIISTDYHWKKDLLIEIYDFSNNALIKSYDSFSLKAFEPNTLKIKIKIINNSSYTLTVSNLDTLVAAKSDSEISDVFGTLKFEEEGEYVGEYVKTITITSEEYGYNSWNSKLKNIKNGVYVYIELSGIPSELSLQVQMNPNNGGYFYLTLCDNNDNPISSEYTTADTPPTFAPTSKSIRLRIENKDNTTGSDIGNIILTIYGNESIHLIKSETPSGYSYS